MDVTSEPRLDRVEALQSPAVLRDAATYMLKVRKAAKSYLGSFGQSEAPWKLMLALSSVDVARNGSHISSLAKRADIPLSTAIRWLGKLHGSGFVRVYPDQADKRASRVQLTANGLKAMQRFLVAARFVIK